MVQVSKDKKSSRREADFTFNRLADFKRVMQNLTVPLIGSYIVNLLLDKLADVEEIVADSTVYASFDIMIYTSEKNLDMLSLKFPMFKGIRDIKPFEQFQELVAANNLLFAKGVIFKLYNIIDHDLSSMKDACDTLRQAYGPHVELDLKKVSAYFVISDVVYPRDVVQAYIWQSRFREGKLKKCLQTFDDTHAYYAAYKVLRGFVENKASYYQTGEASRLTKTLSDNNMTRMYLAFEQTKDIHSLRVSLALYEKGGVLT